MDKLSDIEIKKAQLLKLDYQCSQDPVLFFRTMLHTFDPKREPYHFPFNPFDFQVQLILELVRAIQQGYDIFLDKTREMGATYTVLGVLLWFWKYEPASNFLVGSRKEDYVDNVGKVALGEKTNKEESLFGKLDYMTDRMPPLAKPMGFDPRKHRTYMSLLNPQNGNVIGGESSNPNFSRGGRQKAIVLDEFAFWENDDAAWGSTADTTNCRIVLTTPGIRPNTKAKRLRFGTDGERIKVISLPHYLDPRKDDKWLHEQRERRSREDFAREIMIDWEGSIVGVVYPEAKRREVGNFPYNPAWPVFFAWDFGLDGTALQAWQWNATNGKMRLVEAYKKVGVPIHWWFPFFGEPFDSLFAYTPEEMRLIERFKNFQRGVHFGDPDVVKRSMTTKELSSNREELMKIDIYVQTNLLANRFYNRRNATKVMLQKGIEVNDTPEITGIEGWIESMDYARYPKREMTSQATTAIDLPIHDYTSHHRTATEYLAVNFEEPNAGRTPGVVESQPQPKGYTHFSTDPVTGMSDTPGVDVSGALRESENI